MAIKDYIIQPATATNLLAYAITKNHRYLAYIPASMALKAVYNHWCKPNEDAVTKMRINGNSLQKGLHGAVKVTYGLSAGIAIGDLAMMCYTALNGDTIPVKLVGSAAKAATSFIALAHLQGTPMLNAEYGFRATKVIASGFIEDCMGSSIIGSGIAEGFVQWGFTTSKTGAKIQPKNKPIHTFLGGLCTGSFVALAFRGLAQALATAATIHPVIGTSAEIMNPLIKKMISYTSEQVILGSYIPDFNF